MVVKNGRYGPYVSHGGVNANLPSDMTPETVTLEQALPLLDAREARGTGKNKKPLAKKLKHVKEVAPNRADAEAKTTRKTKISANGAGKPRKTAATKAKATRKPAKATKPATE